MMKKLLVLTAIVMLTAGTVGCNCCNWFRRGALFPTATMVAPDVMCDPCCPADPCDPCGSGASCDPCAPGPYTTTPGTYSMPPATILPGPGPVTTFPSQ